MTGNLSPMYQLRVERLNRARERFRSGRIDENEFRDLLAADGMLDRASQDAEIRDMQPGLRPLGEAVDRIIKGIKP